MFADSLRFSHYFNCTDTLNLTGLRNTPFLTYDNVTQNGRVDLIPPLSVVVDLITKSWLLTSKESK